ncbi:MAG: AAC(3) family N-acetyltransferase [Clostridia bacterium]|nr:AAC(3) family N-acetyltransferase [Clostridia bacterium]
MKMRKNCWDCEGIMVTKEKIARTLTEIGVGAGDICLFHSSFKSLGPVDGGAQAVIDGFESVLGKEGTLAVPTLCQKDFYNSVYKTWYMDKPSDVGYLTEYFRKLPFVYRSDQATHSVAARGKEAYWLTMLHTDHGPHLCPFGEYAFCDSSPWMKMYRRNAKIVFVGVPMRYHTMKHLLEGLYVERLLGCIGDPAKAADMQSRLQRYETAGVGLWPYYDGVQMQEALRERGLLRTGLCEETEFLCVDAKDSSDATLEMLWDTPEDWYDGEMLDWIRECRKG